jgi:hypothetical protein
MSISFVSAGGDGAAVATSQPAAAASAAMAAPMN